MTLALALLASSPTIVQILVVLGLVVLAAVVGLLFLDRQKALKIRACGKELGPLGFVHRPQSPFEDRELGFSSLLPRTPITLHFHRSTAKSPEEHFVEMVDFRRGKYHRYFAALAQRHEGLSLPVFYLRPETVADAFTASLGMNDIDLPGQHLFSTTFHLSGTDKRAVRNLFKGKLAASLARRRNWWISGGGEWLVLHRRRRLHQDDLRDFVRSARNIAKAFVPASLRQPEVASTSLRPANLTPDDPAPPKGPDTGY